MFFNSDGIVGTTFDSCIIGNNQTFHPENKASLWEINVSVVNKYISCLRAAT